MTKQLENGDRVRWNAPGGPAEGEVLHKQTKDTSIKGQQVRASRKEPQYIVRSDNGGKASHKPSALTKI